MISKSFTKRGATMIMLTSMLTIIGTKGAAETDHDDQEPSPSADEWPIGRDAARLVLKFKFGAEFNGRVMCLKCHAVSPMESARTCFCKTDANDRELIEIPRNYGRLQELRALWQCGRTKGCLGRFSYKIKTRYLIEADHFTNKLNLKTECPCNRGACQFNQIAPEAHLDFCEHFGESNYRDPRKEKACTCEKMLCLIAKMFSDPHKPKMVIDGKPFLPNYRMCENPQCGAIGPVCKLCSFCYRLGGPKHYFLKYVGNYYGLVFPEHTRSSVEYSDREKFLKNELVKDAFYTNLSSDAENDYWSDQLDD